MLQEELLRVLRQADGPVSGEAVSRDLGVSRAAVWKAVDALRRAGYTVQALPARGYRLLDSPDVLTPAELAGPERVVGRSVLCLDSVDSTNDECKRQATRGAPDGLAVTAQEQTGGKGRRGRSFQSLAGKGLYLSVLLRPKADPETVSRLTAWVAVAVSKAVERLTGLEPGIKWPNDVLLDGKKLCGILTELGLVAETGELDYVVVGMGINVSQTREDFGPELSKVAVSLAGQGAAVRRAALGRAVLEELDRMYREFPGEREAWLSEYRRRCVTVGRAVKIVWPDREVPAAAIGVDDTFALRVRLESGQELSVSSGEVSVRGMLGYV